MFEFLTADNGFAPHGYCLAWNTPLVWTHIVSDLLIALAYFSIPAVIVVFLRRRKDPSLHGPAMLFVTFITACGLTHLMGIVTLYEPLYGLQGLMKVFTATVSVITAIILWKILPDALKVPSPGHLMAALRDKELEIADREKVERDLATRTQQLAHKVEELNAANIELNEFAYAASHDLKSPANTLSLWLDEFAEEFVEELDGEARESIGEAQRIVERMRELVEDILRFSRVVNAKLDDPEPLDLGVYFDAAVEDLRYAVAEAGAEIEIKPMPKVMGHPGLISILAHNLLNNAIKFRAHDRPLRITVNVERSAVDQRLCVLSIKDNGIGISPEHQDKVFKLFKRLHSQDDYEGTGLGLALCRRIAAAHGGAIEINSDVDQGAEFRILFPLEVSDVAQAA